MCAAAKDSAETAELCRQPIVTATAHSAPFALFLAATVTCAPRDTNALLKDSPMPLLAPVTMTFLPCISFVRPSTTSVLLKVELAMLAGRKQGRLRDALGLQGLNICSPSLCRLPATMSHTVAVKRAKFTHIAAPRKRPQCMMESEELFDFDHKL